MLRARTLLVYSLIFQISGVSASFHRSAIAAESEIVEGQSQLNSLYQELLRQTKYADTLTVGRVNRNALIQKLQIFEDRLSDWKEKIEAELKLPVPPGDEKTFLESISKRVVMINSYFTYAVLLIQSRSMLMSNSTDDRSFELLVPKQVLAQMTGYEMPEGRLIFSGSGAPLSLELVSSGQIALKLSDDLRHQSVTQGILIEPEKRKEAFIHLLKAMVVTTLYVRLNEIVKYKQYPVEKMPVIPRKLEEELEPFKDFSSRLTDDKARGDDTDFRLALIQAGPGLVQNNLDQELEATKANQLLFTNENFVTTLQGFLVPKIIDEKSFRDAEILNLKPNLQADIETHPLITFQSKTELLQSLREILTQAKLRSVMTVLNDLSIPPEKLPACREFLKSSALEYSRNIPDRFLSDWLDDSYRIYKTTLKEARRQKYVEALIEQSVAAKRKLRDSSIDSVDIAILKKSLEKQISALHLKPSTQQAVNTIFAQKSYEGAETQYQKTLLDFQELALKYKKYPPELRIIETDLKGLRALGNLLGFSESSFSKSDQMPRFQRDSYHETLDATVLTYPILRRKVGDKKVYELLADCGENPKCGIEYASRIVNAALDQSLVDVQNSLNRLSEETTLIGLYQIITRSALIHGLVEKESPALYVYLERIKDNLKAELTSESLYSNVSNEFTKPMQWILPLFLIPVAKLLARPSNSIILTAEKFMNAFNGHMAGYMTASLPIMFSGMGHDIYNQNQSKTTLRDMDTFYSTSASQSSFFDYFDVMDAQKELAANMSSVTWSLFTNAFFFVSPYLAPALKRAGTWGVDTWRTKQFETLGFEKNQFSWEAQKIEKVAETRLKEIENDPTSSDDLKETKRGAVFRAKESLLALVKRQAKRRDLFIKDFQSQIRTLGLQNSATPFHPKEIEAAFRKYVDYFKDGSITAKEFKTIQEARSEILAFVHSEWSFSEPGPLQISSQNPSYVRQSLLQEIYGFSPAAPAPVAQDYYAILGIGPQSTRKEITSAYRALAKKYHPDRAGDSPENQAKFRQIQEAYHAILRGFQ